MSCPMTDELLDMVSVLDPRFKLSYISEDDVAPIQARLTSKMVRTAPAAMVVIIVITYRVYYNRMKLSGLKCYEIK